MSRHGLGRRVGITVAGGALVAAGVAMLVLPGPGLVTIALGFSVLGREHAWAARWEQRVRDRIRAAAHRVRRPSGTGSPVVDLRARPSTTARRLEDAA